MLLLRNSDVQRVLGMTETIEALRIGYSDLAAGNASYIPRVDLYAPTGRDDDYYRWGGMTGYCRSYGIVATRIKSDVVSWPAGKKEVKYCVEPGTYSGIIVLYSSCNGEPLALIQDGYLQHMRVGASAGIGADIMSRSESSKLGLLGSGGMARTYLEAIAHVRKIEYVKVYSPTKRHRELFAAEVGADLDIDIVPMGTANEAVRGVDIVATATDAIGPTFDPAMVEPGAHVTCVSRKELSSSLLDRVDVTVQLGVNTIPHGTYLPGLEWRLAGIAAYVAGRPEERELIPAVQETERGVYPSLMDVMKGRHPGRTRPDEVTLFVTTGTQGLQFASVGGMALQLAGEAGVGQTFPTEWFLEDIRD